MRKLTDAEREGLNKYLLCGMEEYLRNLNDEEMEAMLRVIGRQYGPNLVLRAAFKKISRKTQKERSEKIKKK